MALSFELALSFAEFLINVIKRLKPYFVRPPPPPYFYLNPFDYYHHYSNYTSPVVSVEYGLSQIFIYRAELQSLIENIGSSE